jgi:hypothetical protein
MFCTDNRNVSPNKIPIYKGGGGEGGGSSLNHLQSDLWMREKVGLSEHFPFYFISFLHFFLQQATVSTLTPYIPLPSLSPRFYELFLKC